MAKLGARLHNMERQVRDMLIFARGDAVLDESLPVSELLAETRTAAEVLLRSGQQSCQWLDRVGEARLRCNRESLIGALLNLIENALQSAGSEARLEIRAEPEQDSDGTARLRLQVSDDGPGIRPELLDQITEPFFTTRAQGTGLGLAVAQVVARAHQGEFFIQSETRQEAAGSTGTTAGFLLPLDRGCVSGSQQ